MKFTRILFIVLFIIALLLPMIFAGRWLPLVRQPTEPDRRRISEEQLTRLLEQSRRTEQRLAAVAAENEILTSRTLVILERLVPAPLYTPCHEADQPLVLYEAEPVKPARKGRPK